MQRLGVQPVLIPEGQVVQQVFHGAHAALGQRLCIARTDASEVLDGGGELKHALRD